MNRLPAALRIPLSALLVIVGLGLVGALALVVARAATSAATFTCRERLELAAGTRLAPELPTPWRLSLDSRGFPLTGVSAFDGPPEQGSTLVPQSSNAADTVIQWTFSGPFPRGKWLSCDYAGGVVRALREADPETTSCEAQLSRDRYPRLASARFHCR